jgi:hypothetical protein
MGRAGPKNAVHKGEPLPPPAPPPKIPPPVSSGEPEAASRASVRWTWALVLFLWTTAFGFLFLYELLSALMKAIFAR